MWLLALCIMHECVDMHMCVCVHVGVSWGLWRAGGQAGREALSLSWPTFRPASPQLALSECTRSNASHSSHFGVITAFPCNHSFFSILLGFFFFWWCCCVLTPNRLLEMTYIEVKRIQPSLCIVCTLLPTFVYGCWVSRVKLWEWVPPTFSGIHLKVYYGCAHSSAAASLPIHLTGPESHLPPTHTHTHISH